MRSPGVDGPQVQHWLSGWESLSQLPISSACTKSLCNSNQGCLHSHSCPVGEKQVFPCSLKRVKTLPGNLQQLFPWVFFWSELGHMHPPLNISGLFCPQNFSFPIHFGHSFIKTFNKHLLTGHCVLSDRNYGMETLVLFSKKFVFNFLPPVTVLFCIFLSSFSKRKHFFRSMTELLTIGLEKPVSFRKLSP